MATNSYPLALFSSRESVGSNRGRNGSTAMKSGHRRHLCSLAASKWPAPLGLLFLNAARSVAFILLLLPTSSECLERYTTPVIHYQDSTASSLRMYRMRCGGVDGRNALPKTTFRSSPFLQTPDLEAMSHRFENLWHDTKNRGRVWSTNLRNWIRDHQLRRATNQQPSSNERSDKRPRDVDDVDKDSCDGEKRHRESPTTFKAQATNAAQSSIPLGTFFLTSTAPSSSAEAASSTPSSLALLLSPSHIIRISLLAFALAEVLDRLGILYEDTPTVLKSQLDAVWQLDVQPFLTKWKDILSEWYTINIEEPLGLRRNTNKNGKLVVIVGGSMADRIDRGLYRIRLLLKDVYWNVAHNVQYNTKAAFAVGAGVGMMGAPILMEWFLTHFSVVWKPTIAVYAAAEAHHWCKLHGIRSLVDWLGDTPQTLGAVLDLALDRWRRFVRKRVPGLKEDVCYDPNRLLEYDGPWDNARRLTGPSSSQSSSSSMATMVGGGGSGEDKILHKKDIKSIKIKSGGKGDDAIVRDLHDLVEEFKGWMVVPQEDNRGGWSDLYSLDGSHGSSAPVDDMQGRQRRRRNQFVKQGFWVGCALGLALMGRQ